MASTPGRAQNIVAPNAFTTAEGDSQNFLPFFPGTDGNTPPAEVPVRYQQVYAASQFSAVPTGGAMITQISFRLDGTDPTPFALTIPSIQIDLSTARNGPDALSYTFADNVGADDTVVHPSGLLALASTSTTTASGTKSFDITITLANPFFYNPANGPLLLDVRNNSGAGVEGDFATQPIFDASEIGQSSGQTGLATTSRIFHRGDVTAATIDPTNNSFSDGADSLGLVTQFTIVPEPSTWAWLLLSGAALAFALRCRRARSTAAATIGMLALGAPVLRAQNPLPPPNQSGIQHIILVTMENRSVDHLVGWVPGINGSQAGRSYPDKAGVFHQTFAIASGGSAADPRDPNAPAGSEAADFKGCNFADPDHGFPGGRSEYNNGMINGFLLAGTNDLYPLAYYRQQDLPLFSGLFPAFTTFDNYFCPILGPTYPNRFYFQAASTDRIDNTTTTSTLPTIWDRLKAKGVSARYYFGDLPFLPLLFGPRYTNISKPFATFLTDCQNNTLPAYSMVDPRFEDETSGTSVDDHDHADLRNGQAYLNQVYDAVRNSPAWPSTVMVIVYDDWGGFFDHIVPPVGAVGASEIAAGYTDGLRGFRVPCVLISPFAAAGAVSHVVFDHASILKMVEWRFGLQPLAARDAAANNLATALNFSQTPRLTTPSFDAVVPAGTFPPCVQLPAGATVTSGEFSTLRQKAIDAGMLVP